MKITILTYGSRGDVQPFLPLSLRLMDNGHTVKLAAPFRFKDFVEKYGIAFWPLAGEPEDLSRGLNDAGRNAIKLLDEMLNHTTRIGAEVWQQAEAACRDADLILHTFLHAAGAHTLAREKNIPDIHVQLFPMFTPTGDYPNITWPNWGIRSLNRFTHEAASKITRWTSQLGFERVRRNSGRHPRKLEWPFENLPPRPPTPVLCAWSPTVLPASMDWPSHIHVTGYYFFPSDMSYQPPAELEAFLQQGKPPVCITFGSMIHRNSRRIHEIVQEALRKTGDRAVILSGWDAITHQPSDEILLCQEAPHEWLLPRCKLAVHHGGAGTTAAGLRAGIPNIVVPFMGDQPFWGERVRAIGAGPAPIRVRELSVDTLTNALRDANEVSIRERARSLGREIESEAGTREAVKWIEKHSNNFHR